MSEAECVHRSGFFKHENKKHSTGRHRTKREIARAAGGRADTKVQHGKIKKLTASKLERKHRLAQLRVGKIRKLHEQKKFESSVPNLVTILSLDPNVSSESIRDVLTGSDSEAVISKSVQGDITYIAIPKFKSRYGVLCLNQRRILDVLDAVKTSDVLMLVWPLNTNKLTEFNERLLSMIYSQGVPTILNVTHGIPRCGKQRQTLLNMLHEIKSRWNDPSDAWYNLNDSADSLQLMRLLATVKKTPTILQSRRPYLLAEKIEKVPNNSGTCTLKVSGYLRGASMNVNKLVHLKGWGDFQLERIESETDPHPLKLFANKMDDGTTVLALADASKQTLLDSEVIVDPMETEQLGVEIDCQELISKKMKSVPLGTSEYQASWIVDEDANNQEDEEDESNEDLNSEYGANDELESADEDVDMKSNMSTAVDDLVISQDDELISGEQIEKFRQERHNEQWPDEVEAPTDCPAWQRFQKYRGLQSFRTSPWNPKENLPPEYGRIYKISNFKRTKKIVLNEIHQSYVVGNEDIVRSNQFVTLHIANVPLHITDGLTNDSPFVIFGLLSYEHKMSVLNMVIRKHPSYTLPIKNKESLIFQVGFRRFEANPVFSQHTNGQKFKMERFLPNDGVCCATVFAPITFPPATVLVFRRDEKLQTLCLVATGAVMDMNPDRIILKRAVLSGHPFKVNKRTVVVRYMFFNHDDVEWFKPVELHTASGRRGRIKQSLGTHGLIKCTFDQPLNTQDSVLMNLYKRIFPKWTYNPMLKEDQGSAHYGELEALSLCETDSETQNQGKNVRFNVD